MSLTHSATPAVSLAHCANCGAQLTGPYCAQCGQHGHVETPTLWEFIHEYLHHYVALDGKLGRSLWLLLRYPGRLTTEYLAGRRQRYIKPLQLYLTISFLFFIALSQFGLDTRVHALSDKSTRAQAELVKKGLPHPGAKDAQKQAGDTAKTGKNAFFVSTDSDNPLVRKWVAAMQAREMEFRADRQAAIDKLLRQALRYAPYGVFLLMPVFALLLKLLYWGRRMNYGAHLVFSLHVHACTFIVLGAMLLPLPPAVASLLLMAGLPLYDLVALRRVYGGRLRALLPRAALLFVVYTLLSLVTMLGLLALAVVT
jgi:hypothetical protein